VTFSYVTLEHKSSVNAVAYSLGVQNDFIFIWFFFRMFCSVQFLGLSSFFIKFLSIIARLRMFADGSMIASGCEDNKVRLQ
jgi:hypothetical protein